MKRALFTFVSSMMVFIFIFSSCQSNNRPETSKAEQSPKRTEDSFTEQSDRIKEESNNDEEKASESERKTEDSRETSKKVATSEDGFIIDRDSLSIYSLSEYEDFCSTAELPENFIYYEDLKSIGEFEGIVFCSNALGMHDYSEYDYTLIDSTGTWISFSIKTSDAFQSFRNIDILDKKDLRSIGKEEKGVFCENGLRYIYFRGLLRYICWQQGDYYFNVETFTPPNFRAKLWSYPDVNDTFIGMLLNTETAEQALEMIQIGSQDK